MPMYSRRSILRSLAGIAVSKLAIASRQSSARLSAVPDGSNGPKLIVILCGGIRQAETFHDPTFVNIPHLHNDLMPAGLFVPVMRNAGVTSHFNTIASVLTGNWQRLDDWGKDPPASPTAFEYLRKSQCVPENGAWFISSNKALTSQIGASSYRDYGPRFGANVVFPKQLLIDAVVNAATHGRAAHSASREKMQPELEAMLEAANYEGLGWSVAGNAYSLDPDVRDSVSTAIANLVKTSAAATGDEFTYLVAVEVMRRFTPSLLVVTFSDMEAAHFGSYSLHLAGIRTLDRLVYELWNEAGANPAYREKSTLFVLPEFGRDFDGSSTNGFFNHRQDGESTRLSWMLCLGKNAPHGSILERPLFHIDICPTILRKFGLNSPQTQGQPIPELLV
ncbi:MAG TPA: hypothetical protein VGR47_04485 [Terracidiphilus sp.]|nr:hypothetical protein [Terracidiphilus sp.]